MHLDIADLNEFYASPLGRVTRRIIARKLRHHWRRASGETVIALGFGLPYLGSFRGEVRRLGALMPAGQGASVWPTNGPVSSVLVDEERLPLADNSVDKLLAIHCLELSDHARPLLREMWRVLAPEGRLMIVLPNRHGLWSRREHTPFGHGQPYSRAQIEKLLTGAFFVPTAWSTALHTMPFSHPVAVRWSAGVEQFGGRLWPRLGGVILVEARKEVSLIIPSTGVGARSKRLAPADAIFARPAGNTAATASEVTLSQNNEAAPVSGHDGQ